MRENASKTKRYRLWKRAKAKETIEPKKRILNVFWFHFVFLSFYFCFSKVSHQPNRQERLNLPTALNVQRINRWWKAKNSRQIEPATLYHSLCTIPSTHVHIWFHFASFIRSLVHFFPIHTFILSISVWIQCFCFLFSLMIENIDSKHLKMCAVCTMKLALVQTL